MPPFEIKSFNPPSSPASRSILTPNSDVNNESDDYQGTNNGNNSNDKKSSIVNSVVHTTSTFLEFVLEPLHTEPLFTEICYGSPSSEDYMFIEPLFESMAEEISISNKKVVSYSSRNEKTSKDISTKPLFSNYSAIYPGSVRFNCCSAVNVL